MPSRISSKSSPGERGSTESRPTRNGKLGKRELRELMGVLEISDRNTLFNETIDEFKNRWLFDCDDNKDVMRQCRGLAGKKPNVFVQWLIRMRIAFYNADFSLTSEGKVKETADWLSGHAAYPFGKLSRDIWTEYQVTSNAIAFWRGSPNGARNGPQPPPESKIAGLPRVTIFDSEQVRFTNDFGVNIVFITPARRKLTDDEKAALGPRYAKAIEDGKELKLDPRKGEFTKVLTTAKVGYGLGMPQWKGIMQDLAILELLKIGDWNGAWARRKIMRHTKKGHESQYGNSAGSPDYFMKPEVAKKILKALDSKNGYAELISNFDQIMEYVYLGAEFFDAKVYEAIEMRLDRFAGAIGMMMRESANQSPYLMSIFRAEGLAERDIVGSFIRDIVNDPDFQGDQKPPAALMPQWDDTIFFNEKMLIAWIGFAYQNGFASPQTMRRYLRLSEVNENELMKAARTHSDDYQPIFEPKQGLLGPENDGGAAGAAGGRPAKQDGGS